MKLVHTVHAKAKCGAQVKAQISINGWPLPTNFTAQIFVNNRPSGQPITGDKYTELVDLMVASVLVRVEQFDAQVEFSA